MKSLILMLVATVLATMLASMATRHRDQFSHPKELIGNATDPNRDNEAESEAVRRTELKNTTLVYALIGGSLGFVLSVTAGLIGGHAAVAGGIGLVLGSLNGAAAGAVSRTIYDRVFFSPSAMPVRGPLIHTVLWVMTGAAIAIAVGLATRRRLTGSLLSALAIYGLVASAVYSPVAGILFPMHDSDRPIPEGEWNAVLWIAIPTAFFAFSLARSLSKRPILESLEAVAAPTHG